VVRTVSLSRSGVHWYAAIAWQGEVADTAPSALPAVGIDRGIAIFAALSSGTNYTAPSFFGRIERQLANAQRTLARRVKGSANWRKQKARIARLHMKAANARRDFLHKVSLDIAK